MCMYVCAYINISLEFCLFKMDKKVSRKSASKWNQCGERILIKIWAEKVNQLRSCRKNSHIVKEMASRLEAQGFNYSWEEIKTKMHNMSNRYRKEKLKMRTTGGSPSDWDLFTEMENLLRPFKSYNFQALVVDSIKNINTDMPSYSERCDISPASPTPSLFSRISPHSPTPSHYSPQRRSSEKKKKNDNIDRLIKSMEKTMETLTRSSERILEIEKEKLEIWKNFAKMEAEFQDKILNILNKV